MKKNFIKKTLLIGIMLVLSITVLACKQKNNGPSQDNKPIYTLDGVLDEWTMYCYEDLTMNAVVLMDGEQTQDTITWSSSDTSVATVDASGKILAIKEGTATITASASTISKTCAVTVLAPNGEPQLIVDSDETIGMVYNSFYQLQPTVYYNGKAYKDMTLQYVSSTPTIAQVDANGLVHGIAQGETTITVSASWRGVQGIALTESVAVKIDELIEFRFTNTNVNSIYTTAKDFDDGNDYYNTVEYGVTVLRNEQPITTADNIEWKSTNQQVATVEGGVVTATGAGETEIYVEYTPSPDKVYTSQKIALTVILPVIEKDINLAFGANDTTNELKATKIFDDGNTIESILDVTEFREVEITYANENVSGIIEDSELRDRVWVISNGEYAYKVNVFIATNVIRQATDLGALFNYSLSSSYYSVGTPNNSYYVLDGNIDASEYTHGHGKVDSSGVGLTGTFDGRGYVIDGITFTNAGLFGYVAGGTIKNLGLTNVKMQTSSDAYVITRQSTGMTIDNVFVSVDYSASGTNQGLFAKAWGKVTVSNLMVVATGGNSGAFAVNGADANGRAENYTYTNVYAISTLQPVCYGESTGITIYADVDTFKTNVTTSELTNFNEYWDLTKDYPVFINFNNN